MERVSSFRLTKISFVIRSRKLISHKNYYHGTGTRNYSKGLENFMGGTTSKKSSIEDLR